MAVELAPPFRRRQYVLTKDAPIALVQYVTSLVHVIVIIPIAIRMLLILVNQMVVGQLVDVPAPLAKEGHASCCV